MGNERTYDAIVVGAGPAGTYLSAYLAREGLEVLILEEHSKIGKPVHCTGIIGKEGFNLFPLTKRSILGELKSALFFSPSGLSFSLAFDDPQGFVIDRALLDQDLAQKAIERGSDIKLNTRVKMIEVKDGSVKVVALENDKRTMLKARVCILATGSNYKLQRRLGMGMPSDFLHCAQVEVDAEEIGHVRIYFGREIAPGSFAWIVPFKRKEVPRTRIGMSTEGDAFFYFNKFLSYAPISQEMKGQQARVMLRSIPLGPIAKTFCSRVLAVGDAAGLVKPTTGGGVFYSLLSSKMAAETIIEAFKKGDFSEKSLGMYEKRWKEKFDSELRVASYFRWIASKLQDSQIDALFRVASSDGILSMIKTIGQFNWHKSIILAFLKHPEIRKIVFKSLHN